MKKRLLCILSAVVFMLMVTGCADKKQENSIVDSETGAKIAVGMSKGDVERQFDESEIESDQQGSYYKQSHIVYDADELVDVIFIREGDDNWTTSAGIGIGSGKEDVIKIYGEADEIEKDTYWLYHNSDVDCGFLFQEEEVYFITIYRRAQ